MWNRMLGDIGDGESYRGLNEMRNVVWNEMCNGLWIWLWFKLWVGLWIGLTKG